MLNGMVSGWRGRGLNLEDEEGENGGGCVYVVTRAGETRGRSQDP